jgi:predicted NACHT family NTPase
LGFVLREFSKDDIKEKNSYVTNLKKYICDFLEDINVLLLLDGFDEINDIQVRKILVEDIELISTSFVKSKILVTSRTAEFNYDISNTQTYEIAPLDNSQIDIFINHYIKDLAEATKFKKELLASPYFDTSRKPLALAHLCAIYERYHNLPPKPKSVYKKNCWFIFWFYYNIYRK